MDYRYMPIINFAVKRFSDHLGDRLISVYAKGSVARGDAVWGVSDLDLVFAFDSPTHEDTLMKRQTEEDVQQIPGGKVLVIQRIWDDRLAQMDEKTKAYWIYSSWYDSEVYYGKHPSEFLPAPAERSVELILSLLVKEGRGIADLTTLDELGCRAVAKRILQCLSMLIVYEGAVKYVPLLSVPKHPLPSKIQAFLPTVIDYYCNPKGLTDTNKLIQSWQQTLEFIRIKLPKSQI